MRKDVERLNVKMKEEIGSMKHESVSWVRIVHPVPHDVHRIQMELETRKNEAKAELKLQDIAIEVGFSVHFTRGALPTAFFCRSC